MQTWTPDYIASKVYNREYIKYDPDYAGARPTNYANMLLNNIHYSRYPNIKHLDYGSGEGLLSKILTSKKWNSTNYDPYSMPSKPVGLFNFITAIEVAEHAASIEILIKDIKQYLTKDGVILISTLLSEESTKISWDYILPRCGHISMVSEKTMKIVAKNNGLFFKTISINLHTLQPYRSNAKNVLGWLNG
jgi:2-polyprenyl-3-methyl-5-hydroxy-6-metoxy-1,4-benzoquinol methylase